MERLQAARPSMSVGVIDPINECKIASDGDLKFPSGVVKVSGVGHCEWIVADDCPLAGTDPWADRPGVTTSDARVVLAGDGIRCELPVALMERAATTGWLAASSLLTERGLPGHDVWTVPLKGRGQPLAHAARRAMAALSARR